MNCISRASRSVTRASGCVINTDRTNRRCRSAHDVGQGRDRETNPMSSTNPENSTDPEQNLTPAEIDNLNRLEAIAQSRLGSYLLVGNALGEIRDRRLYRASHPSFETYVRERWGLSDANGAPLSQATTSADARVAPTPDPEPRAPDSKTPCELLARACEETLSALDGDARLGLDIRLAVRKPGDPGPPADGMRLDPAQVTGSLRDELVPTLRWLLTQATGTIGEVSHQLESHAADIDDGERAQLWDDVLVLDGELAIIKALLIELHDWDSELRRLLKDELPPFDTDTDPHDDE